MTTRWDSLQSSTHLATQKKCSSTVAHIYPNSLRKGMLLGRKTTLITPLRVLFRNKVSLVSYRVSSLYMTKLLERVYL